MAWHRSTTYTPDSLTEDPLTPEAGEWWHRSDLGRHRARLGGVSQNLATEVDICRKSFDADQLLSPNNTDWVVNSLAPLAGDSNNSALSVRSFDDTVEEGVGFLAHVPPAATSLRIKLVSRAETAPAGARTVGVKLYNRGIPNDGAVESWSAGNALDDVDIPTNENFQYDEKTFTLASLGVTAGELTQFELTRANPVGGTELTGDWILLTLEIEFI